MLRCPAAFSGCRDAHTTSQLKDGNGTALFNGNVVAEMLCPAAFSGSRDTHNVPTGRLK